MKRLLALLVLVIFLWPAAAGAAVQLCAISGQVFNPDGTTLNNGVVQFNSQVTQVVGSTTIPPSIISTTTDANGNMAPMSVAQGLFGTFQFCQGHSGTNVGGAGGGCAAAINGLIPINTTGNIQAVIAGTLLPSVGNATVNNLTATNDVNVGAQLQTQTLLVNGNSTLSGTLNVTGTVTTNGAMTAPSLTLSQTTCSALTLAQAVISSNPPNGDLLIEAGAHCNGGGFVADANSAIMFGNYYIGTGPINNAGWQWLGNQGLTVGSTFTPTVRMSLDNTGMLSLPSTATAVQFAGGSLVSANSQNLNLTMGAHYNGSSWIADQPNVVQLAEYMLSGPTPGVQFVVGSGLTVGGSYAGFPTQLAFGNANGWTLYGTNPVAILQSQTDTNADVLEILPQNNTQGIGIIWSGIHSIGSQSEVNMTIDAKGLGSILLNSINVGGPIYATGGFAIQDDYHLATSNNGVAYPGLGTCSAGSFFGTSTDVAGQVNFTAAGATSCAINFGRSWAGTPMCVCSVMVNNPGGVGACAAAVNSTSATFYFSTAIAAANAYLNYHCTGVQ